MRLLVACGRCKRQYDAGAAAVGSRFRCACGATITVAHPAPRDAAVVRCSSCGAPRHHDAAACSYCQADFTLAEREMQTICPSCAARISDRARLCHHCGIAIAPEGSLGSPSDHPCPACGRGKKLNSRQLERASLSVLECPGCAGLWLGRATFESLAASARSVAGAAGEDPARPADRSAPGTQGARARSLYRPCPVCSKLMNRRNWAGKSGVILDACKEHGLWFDARELDDVLDWIRSGGERRAEALRVEEQRQAARAERIELLSVATPERGRDDNLLTDLLRSLFERVSS